MHVTSGRWKLGFGLALCTTALWSVLPIALKLLLEEMDAYTITFYRMLAATLVLGAFQAARGKLPKLSELSGAWWLLAVAAVGLAINYLGYLIALYYVSPGTAQVVIQLAPMLLLLGGLLFFRESFGRVQWFGFGILAVGLLLFFNDRLSEFTNLSGAYAFGVFLVVIASVTWATYALAQKQLLKHLDSENIMLLIYVASVFMFLPLSTPATLTGLSGFGFALLAFTSFNTLAAYGCFAEALDHWEASRVSAVLAITPLLTLLASEWISHIWPDAGIEEQLNTLSLVGALLVVGGSILTALGRSRPRTDPEACVESVH